LVTLVDGRVKQFTGYAPMDARRKAWRVYGRGTVTRIEEYA
jgi:hypothetical protein